MNKCLGCGAILQSTDTQKTGYIIKEKITTSKYCERCYKIIHYNEKKATHLPHINEYILKEVNEHAEFVYFMVDILNINTETMNTYHQIKKPKSLIISKLDIIPKSIKKEKIKKWLNATYQITDKVFFQSSKKNLNNRSLLKNIEEKNFKTCHIIGYTNSGKSSLINKLCEINNVNHELTTCLIPNTTIDFIKIKLNEHITIIDSPGFTLKNPIYKDDDFELIEAINPRKPLSPITYQVKPISYINIHDLIAINSNAQNSLTLYLSNALNVSRTFKIKQPVSDMKHLTFNIPANTDLIIKSVGYINIKEPCTLTIYSDNESLFEIRKSMFDN